MALNFFPNGEILYWRTLDLGFLICIGASKAAKLLEQIHARVCGTHINGLTIEKKILRVDYFWMTMELNCCKFVHNCHKCQVYGDFILVLPHELNVISLPRPFVSWGMDVIGP